MSPLSPVPSRQIVGDMRTEAPPRQPSGALARFRGLSAWGVVVTRCEVALAAIFLWAAWNKLRPPNGPQLFNFSVHAFDLHLPVVLERLATSVTPWIETVSALALLFGIWTRAAAGVLGFLLILFIALIVQALARHLNVECGCFGKLSPFCHGPVGVCNIVQNVILLGIAAIIAFSPRSSLVQATA